MTTEVKKEIELEIVHVLFMDIVGYSKLLNNEQQALVGKLNQVVRGTAQFQSAEAAGRLIKIPTGDGMALVFSNSLEAPVKCALQISRELKKDPNLPLRMGVHSGPVSRVVDVNGRANVAGGGINFAERVMDCGDAGHILLSRRVAEDLEQYGHWQSYLHDLGECEVKHGLRVHIVNLYTEELGNPKLPERFELELPKRKPISQPALTLKQISEKVDNAGYSNRDEVRNALVGLAVDWTLSFSSASRSGDSMLAYFFDLSSRLSVVSRVPLKGNERFPLMDKTNRFRVRGTIAEVDILAVYLKDVTVERVEDQSE